MLSRERITVGISYFGMLLCMLVGMLNWMVMKVGGLIHIIEIGGISDSGWVPLIYMMAEVCVLCVSGRLSDKYGIKLIMILGLIPFISGCIGVMLADSVNMLLFSRAVQGIGSGMILGSTLTGVGLLFKPEHRGEPHGILTASFTLGSIFGMAMGLWFFENYEWYYPFNLSIVLMSLGVLLSVIFLPKQEIHPERKFPFFGAITLFGFVLTVMLYTKYCDVDFDVFDITTMIYLFFALDFGGAFILHEMWSDDPILPRSFFKNKVQCGTILMMLFVGIFAIGVMQSIIKLFVLYFYFDFYKATFQIFILIAGGAITSLTASFIIPKTGVRFWLLLGTVLSIFALVLVSLFGYKSAFNLQICMFFIGLGFGCFVTQLMYGSQFFTEQKDMGTMSHTMLLSRFFGIIIGNAIFADVLMHVMKDNAQYIHVKDIGDVEDILEFIFLLIGNLEDAFAELMSWGVQAAVIVAAVGIILVGITAYFIKADDRRTKVRSTFLEPKEK